MKEKVKNNTEDIQSGIFQKMLGDFLARKEKFRTTQKEIEKGYELLKKKEKENIYPHWTEYLVRPLIHEIAKLTPDIEWEHDERLLCFGLRSECPILGQNSEGIAVALNFTFRGDCLYYDTGETKGNYASDPNGFNNLTAPVENINQLITVLRCQIENEKKVSDNGSTSQ